MCSFFYFLLSELFFFCIFAGRTAYSGNSVIIKNLKTIVEKEPFLHRVRRIARNNLPLTVIIVAAVLLELTMGVMYYAAQRIINDTMQKLVETEMDAIYLGICNKFAKVEVTVDNLAWTVTDDMKHPDSLKRATYQLVEHNPELLGSCAACIPNYYPEKGYWYEAYSVRHADGSIQSFEIGSARHDYTKMEFFKVPFESGVGHWCYPYNDDAGAKTRVITYGMPVRDGKGKIAAVLGADIPYSWLVNLLEESKSYGTTQRFVVTESGELVCGEESHLFKQLMKLIKSDSDKQGYELIEDQHGEKLYVFFHTIGGMTDWVLVSTVNDSEVSGKLWSIRMKLLTMIAIGLLLIGFVVYRSSRDLERLRKVNAEKERIGGELRVASQIQHEMLPKSHYQQDDIEIYGSLVPAREVGGDLYDYYVRDEKLLFCIGDVSGKGAASAMLMGVMHSLFRAISAHENNPARIMQSINEESCRGNDSNQFVTLFIGVLDLPTGHLYYCDAGHDAPIILENGQLRHEACKPHLPVGVFADVKYEVQKTKLIPGSTLFLYTDGLTEARSEQREFFGLSRVEAVLQTCGTLSPEGILTKVTDTVRDFMKHAEQSDDLTMLAIRYTPRVFESTLSETLVITNRVEEVAKYTDFMKSVMERLQLDTSFARQLRLAVEEALVNVIDYAYPSEIEGKIELHIMSDGHTLKTVIKDYGVAFDPTTQQMADTSLSAEERQIGGLGILLVRELMDTVNYERYDGMNILTLTKKLK